MKYHRITEKNYRPPKTENLPGTGIDEEFGDVEFAAMEEAREDSLELVDLSAVESEEGAVKKYVKQYVSSNGFYDMSVSDMVLEVVCEVAEYILEDRYPNMEHTVLIKEGDSEMSHYTPESQELFNRIHGEVNDYVMHAVLSATITSSQIRPATFVTKFEL